MVRENSLVLFVLGIGFLMQAKIKNKMSNKQIILGQPPSKSNCYRIITIHGHASLSKANALKKYEAEFFKQCSLRDKNISNFFELYIDVFFHSNQPDLDNALKVVLDCLQSCKAIKNDRFCVKIEARKFIDKNNPRIEFSLVEVADIEVVDSRQPTLDFAD